MGVETGAGQIGGCGLDRLQQRSWHIQARRRIDACGQIVRRHPVAGRQTAPLRRVDLAHAGVEHSPDLRARTALESGLGHRGQGVDRDQRPVQPERQPLADRAGAAQPRERTRPAAEADGVELRQRPTGLRQQFGHRGQQAGRRQRAARQGAGQHLIALHQGQVQGFGGGIEGEQSR